MDFHFELERFVDAQNPVYSQVLEELSGGHKRTHWMWFIFPQIAGLGSSPMSEKYSIKSSDEAAAYLAHPVLGPRLRQCTQLVAAHEDKLIGQIFDSPDDRKFHSCMTLFADVAPDESMFQACLDQFFHGEADPGTLERL